MCSSGCAAASACFGTRGADSAGDSSRSLVASVALCFTKVVPCVALARRTLSSLFRNALSVCPVRSRRSSSVASCASSSESFVVRSSMARRRLLLRKLERNRFPDVSRERGAGVGACVSFFITLGAVSVSVRFTRVVAGVSAGSSASAEIDVLGTRSVPAPYSRCSSSGFGASSVAASAAGRSRCGAADCESTWSATCSCAGRS